MKQLLSIIFVVVPVLVCISCSNSDSSRRTVQTTKSLTITGLGLSSTELSVFHPTTFTVTVLSPQALTDAGVAIGLMEEVPADATDEEKANAASCALDVVRIENIAANTPTSGSAIVTVHDQCPELGEGKSYNVFAFIDPDEVIDETGEGEELNNAVVYNTAELAQPANQACISDSGEVGCIYSITLSQNPGLDLSVSSLELESAVYIVQPPEDHVLLTAGSNEHNFPHVKVDMAIRLDGVDTELEDGLPGDTEIRYDICPDNGQGECAQTWLPLTIYAVPNEPDGHDRSEPVDSMSGAHDYYFSHELFAEQNTLAAMEQGGEWSNYDSVILRACVNIDRAAEPNYDAEAFSALPEAPGEGFDSDSSNNCRTVSLTVARPASREASTALARILKDTSKLSFSESDSHFWGSHSTIGVTAEFGTSNSLDLSGAHSHTSSDVDLDGWLKATLFGLDADADALVAIVGSNIGLKVVGLDTTLYSYSREVPELHHSKTWDVSKKVCGTFSYGIYILSLDVDVCAEGKMGFEADLDIVAKDGAGTGIFADSTTIGSVDPVVRPFLDFDGSASAYASVEVAKAGVEADISILDQSLPVTGTLEWGLTDPTHLVANGNIKMEAKLTSLKGKLYLYADVKKVKWCHKWGVPYPCGSHWSRKATKTIVRWHGKSYDYTILDRSKQLTLTQ